MKIIIKRGHSREHSICMTVLEKVNTGVSGPSYLCPSSAAEFHFSEIE